MNTETLLTGHDNLSIIKIHVPPNEHRAQFYNLYRVKGYSHAFLSARKAWKKAEDIGATIDQVFVKFTRRTNTPKLTWLINALEDNNIACYIDGESWHAPILWVDSDKIEIAFDILTPIDDIDDDDPRFKIV